LIRPKIWVITIPNFEENNGSNGSRRVVSLADAQSGRRAERGNKPKFGEALDKQLQQEDRAELAKIEKNMAPARIVESRCHVCQHPYRDWIETMLVRGMSFKGIQDRVPPPANSDYTLLDRRSISNHYKKHMDLQDAALRSIIESEAQLQGINQDEGVQDAITKRAVLEVALRKGYQDVLNGVTTVEPRDLIQIAKVLAEMDTHQYQMGLDELRAQVQIFIQAIKDVCDEDTRNAIASQVKKLRTREGVTGQIEKAMDPPELPQGQIVDAEVVDEA
jgi:hypothetical protein